jgi:hypothetical protein
MKSWHSHWTILPSQQCFLFTVIVINRRPVVSLCIRFSSDLIDGDGLIIGQSIQFFVAPAMVKKIAPQIIDALFSWAFNAD